MADLTQARETAAKAKREAKGKIEAARRAAEEARFLRANPPAQYVEMPQPTGDVEVDSAADLDAVQAGFRKRATADKSRKHLATDSEYWACLCFQTRAQKDAFLTALNLIQFGDKYLDGREVARALGVSIPDEKPPYHDTAKVDKTWAQFVD